MASDAEIHSPRSEFDAETERLGRSERLASQQAGNSSDRDIEAGDIEDREGDIEDDMSDNNTEYQDACSEEISDNEDGGSDGEHEFGSSQNLSIILDFLKFVDKIYDLPSRAGKDSGDAVMIQDEGASPEMTLQDRAMEETKDKKNAVEAYVYDMRNKLSDKLQEFVTDSEREAFITKLQETENWLYEGGEDCVAKLEELKKQGDAIEERYKEHTERGRRIEQLAICISGHRGVASIKDPWFDHIALADKEKVLKECDAVEEWLSEKKQQQDSLPKHATPVLLSADVKRMIKTLDGVCGPLMMKLKPEATKPATDEFESSDSSVSVPPQDDDISPSFSSPTLDGARPKARGRRVKACCSKSVECFGHSKRFC